MLAVLTSGESSSLQQLALLWNKAEITDTALASSQVSVLVQASAFVTVTSWLWLEFQMSEHSQEPSWCVCVWREFSKKTISNESINASLICFHILGQ